MAGWEDETGEGSVLDGFDVKPTDEGPDDSVLDGTDVEGPQLDLKPAERDEPDPEDGWKAADLDDDERVDDEFIANDPDSRVV